jgi:protein-disulfide isomerase
VKKVVGFSVSFALFALLASPGIFAASTKQEIIELKEEVAALKEGQDAMQKDLAEIKKLIQEGARPAAPAAPTFQPKDVTIDGAPVLGNADATVTLMEFSDYQCPFCARHYRDVMPTLVKEYVDTGKLKFVMRESPILSIHPRAMAASQAALCANDQGKYWDMHNKLFDNQRDMTDENLKSWATELGLDAAAFTACLDGKKHEEAVNDDLAVARGLGVRGTPGFVVGLTDPNDPNKAHMTQFINGAQPLDTFKRTIDELLAEAAE